MLLHITNLIWSCPAGRVYWNGNCDLYLHAQSWGVRNGLTQQSRMRFLGLNVLFNQGSPKNQLTQFFMANSL